MDDTKNLHQIFEELQSIFPGQQHHERELRSWFRHYLYLLELSSLYEGNTLEIGTGFGVLAAGLSKQPGKTVFTIEHPSRTYFHESNYANYFLKNRIHLIGADVNDGLPFASHTFDLICCCDVIEHLWPKQIDILSNEIHRTMKPGGYLILSTPNLGRIQNIWRFLKGQPVNPKLSVDTFGDTFGHIREFLPKELIEIFASFDLKKIAYRPLLPVDDYFFSKKGEIMSTVAYFFPRWREEFYLLMRKR